MPTTDWTNGPSGPPLLSRAGLVAALFAFAMAATAATAEAEIVLDGVFEDWREAPIVVRDPADAAGAEVDLGVVRVETDKHFVHLFVEIGSTVNAQRLDGRLDLLLNADGDRATGETMHEMEGVDAILTFTPPHPSDPSREGMGVGLAVPGAMPATPLSPYDVGFAFAPTYASDRIEIRIERGRRAGGAGPLLAGKMFECRIVYTDASGVERDRTDIFPAALSRYLDPAPPSDESQADDPLARAPGCDLRVMSWNVEWGGLVKHGAIARRIVEAVDPDVILVQELTDANTAQEIESILNGAPSRTDVGRRERWRAFVGGGGGNLRCAVIARHPLERGGAPEPIDYPHRAGRYRSASLVVEPNGRRLLVLSAHLKCCGRIGDSSDEKRVNESTAIREALRAAKEEMRIDGLVVGGDLNLVGGRKPLEILAGGLDLDGSPLEIAAPLQLDGRSNATWADPDQPFVPGRLDYLLVSDKSLALTRSFVLDTRDLAPRWQRHHGVTADDTTLVSDHFPVVADLRWREP